jgi:hypothetical protein
MSMDAVNASLEEASFFSLEERSQFPLSLEEVKWK